MGETAASVRCHHQRVVSGRSRRRRTVAGNALLLGAAEVAPPAHLQVSESASCAIEGPAEAKLDAYVFVPFSSPSRTRPRRSAILQSEAICSMLYLTSGHAREGRLSRAECHFVRGCGRRLSERTSCSTDRDSDVAQVSSGTRTAAMQNAQVATDEVRFIATGATERNLCAESSPYTSYAFAVWPGARLFLLCAAR